MTGEPASRLYQVVRKVVKLADPVKDPTQFEGVGNQGLPFPYSLADALNLRSSTTTQIHPKPLGKSLDSAQQKSHLKYQEAFRHISTPLKIWPKPYLNPLYILYILYDAFKINAKLDFFLNYLSNDE